MKEGKYNSTILQEILEKITPLEMEKTKTKMLLATRIEDFLIANKWTKAQFASKTSRRPSEITKWLSGTHNFTLDTLTEIAHALGIDLTTLFGKPQKDVLYKAKMNARSIETPVIFNLLTPLEDNISSETHLKIVQPSNQVTVSSFLA
jgi:transcriptional regulator with XRE-family HTH domain